MNQRAGFTLFELLTAMVILSFTLFAILNLLIHGLRSFGKTTTDVNISQQNAQGMRRVIETIRAAVNVTISSDGKTLSYTLPLQSGSADPITGEKEYAIPIASDGVTRFFHITNGELRDQTGRVLVRSIATTDPEPTSSQYNQQYAPFQSTTIGSRRAITVNLITQEQVNGMQRWARMKSTVLIRNSP